MLNFPPGELSENTNVPVSLPMARTPPGDTEQVAGDAELLAGLDPVSAYYEA